MELNSGNRKVHEVKTVPGITPLQIRQRSLSGEMVAPRPLEAFLRTIDTKVKQFYTDLGTKLTIDTFIVEMQMKILEPTTS